MFFAGLLILMVVLGLLGTAQLRRRGLVTPLALAIPLLMAALLASLLVVFTSDPVDRCLDKGGRWNYALKRCEGCADCPPIADTLSVGGEGAQPGGN